MEKKFDCEKNLKASKTFVEGLKRKDSIKKISEDAGVPPSRIAKWKNCYDYIYKTNRKNMEILISLASVGQGVSEEVLCKWVRAIDERMEDIKKCGALSSDIRRILEDVGKRVNSHVVPRKARITKDMTDLAVATLILQTGEQKV
jgi:hypothetical protein